LRQRHRERQRHGETQTAREVQSVCVGLSPGGADVVGRGSLVVRDPLAADHADAAPHQVGHHARVHRRRAQRGRLETHTHTHTHTHLHTYTPVSIW